MTNRISLASLLCAGAVLAFAACRPGRVADATISGSEGGPDAAVPVTDAGTTDQQDGGTVVASTDAGEPPDAGNQDSGASDAGSALGDIDAGPPPMVCDGDAGPPDGGITWGPGLPATVSPPQDAGWVAVSDDPECAAVAPGLVPPQLSFTAPADMCVSDSDGGTQCYCFGGAAAPDGQGDIAIASNMSYRFFRADGTGTVSLKLSYHENGGIDWRGGPPSPGWFLGTETWPSECLWARVVDTDGTPSPALPIGGSEAPNPLGGYVEIGFTYDQWTGNAIWLRWVNDSFLPIGAWHPAFHWPGTGYNFDWQVLVDQQGRALVLSFIYPESFGAPASPSEWRFGARWMGLEGPLTNSFVPPAPTFTPTSSSGYVSFAGWGNLVPLPQGGFAAYRDPANSTSGGTISPSGWYASFPSAQPGMESIPAWLQQYDGSLQLLPNRRGYAALRRDANSCKRTAVSISSSGSACFTLLLDASDGCDGWNQYLYQDGTLVLLDQQACKYRWWPGLVRPSQ